MNRRRLAALGALAKGVVIAVLITLMGMLLLAAGVIYLKIGDTGIRITNQLLKVLAVALGALVGVGRGGQRGLITGAATGAVYAVLGYALYAYLGENRFDIVELMGEMTICMASGAVTGAICANLRPRRRTTAAKKPT